MLSRSRLLLRRGACAFRASAPLRSASETGGNGGEPTTPTDRDLIALLKPREALFDTSKKRRRTFYETVYKIPHFAEGKRVTRKLWLMQGHQNTYVTLQKVRFVTRDEKEDNKRAAKIGTATGWLTWHGKVLDPPEEPRVLTWLNAFDEWQLWYPEIVTDFRKTMKETYGIPPEFPFQSYIPEKRRPDDYS
mmetsp:Transcript_785/g.2544  ORF Transcript_785/g.2544 Transcript_785/m.2544 type:complete len:191 (+) Transcript_785:216-788(+)